jgi:predicted DsbA family dithiol-disulfide isomerase
MASSTDPRIVWTWYDFLCPFCYVGQTRNAILRSHGLIVVEKPFHAHPGIPRGGIPVGPRYGAMYAMLERECKEAGLPLRWPARLPDTRLALAVAEWTRRWQPGAFAALHRNLFTAHFALGEDLGDRAIIDQYAAEAGVDVEALHAAIAEGVATASVQESEDDGRASGVEGTPAWLIAGELIAGLRSRQEFEFLATRMTS